MERIVVVGAGHMGSVIVRGLVEGLPEARVVIVEPSADRRRALTEGWAAVEADHRPAVAAAYEPEPDDLVILAIPPTAFEPFTSALPPDSFRAATVVSIMAGVRLEKLASGLGTDAVLRAMPNLAARVGQSMTVLCPGAGVTPGALHRAERALSVTGRVLVLHDEPLLDAATALAGSGPALIAYVAEAFTSYARQAGFDASDALTLTCQVLRGTADVLEETGTDPAELCRRASTPNGTTAAGLERLRDRDVQGAVREALGAAEERGRQLAK